jgi:hydrogenase maturation protease
LALKVTIIGLGNILLQDEGLGVRAVEALAAEYELPPELEVVDGGTCGLDLLPFIEGRDRVLFVDAVNFKKAPGHVGVLQGEEIPSLFVIKDSLHHIGLMDVLAAARLLEIYPPEVCLIGMQPHVIATGLELSEAAQARLPELLALILGKLEEWGISCRRRTPDTKAGAPPNCVDG